MNKKGQSLVLSVGVVVFFVIVIATIIVLLMGFDKVEASKLGVQVKFGKIVGIQEPSLKWTGLWTDVYQYDMRLRKAELTLAGDNSAVDNSGQYVSAIINVNYRVKRDHETVRNLYANVGVDKVIADRLNINPIILEGFKQATVRYDALEILDKRQEVKELAKENIRANFPAEYFEIEQIVITNIDFSQQFKQAIEDKKTAEQRAIEEENKLQVVIFQQQQKIEEYKAQAELIRLQSETLTELTLRQKYLDEWDGKLPVYMIASQDTINMFLPAPELVSTPAKEQPKQMEWG